MGDRNDYVFLSEVQMEDINEAVRHFEKNDKNICDDVRYLSDFERKQFWVRFRGKREDIHECKIYNSSGSFLFWEMSTQELYDRYPFMYFSNEKYDKELCDKVMSCDKVTLVRCVETGEMVMNLEELNKRFDCSKTKIVYSIKNNKVLPDGNHWERL